MKKLIIAVSFVLTGCVSVPLSTQEKAVRILRKTDPPSVCRDLGNVHAPGLASISDEGRESDLRRAAFKKGGNTVTIDRRDENNTIFGRAYDCPEGAIQ